VYRSHTRLDINNVSNDVNPIGESELIYLWDAEVAKQVHITLFTSSNKKKYIYILTNTTRDQP
jgi:hypothetical protein